MHIKIRHTARIALKGIARIKFFRGSTHKAAFITLKEILKIALQVMHLKDNYVISVFTDASDKLLARMVTKVKEAEIINEVQKEKHLPLAFLRRKFSKAQENWTMYEKEAFIIVMFLKIWITYYGAQTGTNMYGL